MDNVCQPLVCSSWEGEELKLTDGLAQLALLSIISDILAVIWCGYHIAWAEGGPPYCCHKTVYGTNENKDDYSFLYGGVGIAMSPKMSIQLL